MVSTAESMMMYQLNLCTLELDKLINTLERTEKKIKEADHGLYVAKEDIRHLTTSIKQKETDMQLNEQKQGPISATLAKESAK